MLCSKGLSSALIESLEGRQLMSAAAMPSFIYPSPNPTPTPTPPPVITKPAKAKKGKDLFAVTSLVSDGATPAAQTDPNVVNAWGLVASPTGPWWVSNDVTSTSSTFDSSGAASTPPVIAIPGAPPTGVAFRSGTGFNFTSGANTGPAEYLYATVGGTIAAANPDVDAANAVTVVDNSASGAVYTGVALATSTGGGERLFAADFQNSRIDAFDSTFAPVTLGSGAFTDPKLPTGFSPFNIANVGNQLFVEYAHVPVTAGEHEQIGKGKGVVDVFDADGTLVQRFAKKKTLNAPWGVAVAPAGLGSLGGDILIGNFGDGHISAYTPAGKSKGLLKGANKKPLTVDGLWGLGFGNGVTAGPTTTLFFAAGPANETHGVFGSIALVGS